MIVFIRFLPLLAALSNAALFWFQTKQQGTYPFFVLIGVAIVPVASFLIAWRRLKLTDLLEKMTPTFVCLLSLAFGLLLAERPPAILTIVALAAAATYLSLELLFLLAYNPSAYPVNGLSRVNMAYVPIAVWYAVSTSAGLLVFLHTSRAIHVLMTVGLGAILFRTTNHPGASSRQNAVWTLVGVLVGLEIGWIGLLLPLSMGMQGILAALIFTSALRVRRYLFDPKPSRRLAWSEAAAICLSCIVLVGTAKWL